MIIYNIKVIIHRCLLKATLSKIQPQGALPIITMEFRRVIQSKSKSLSLFSQC
jgi:hypothetical protein